MNDSHLAIADHWFYALITVGVFLNATGLFPPILEIDGALYACIAKNMALSGDFVNLYAVGSDWLDKPHFPFWIAAISYRIFGINTFAYKFPALLFFLGSVVYTYQFARLAYPKVVAQVAALVLLTAFHGVLSNSDVRAEPYLMPLIIGAAYHFYRLFVGGRAYHLLIGSFLTGCALMTKGCFVLIPIGAGLVLHWLLTGHWRELLNPRWYVALVVSFAFTLPEIYCLYQQFDLHPEKVVFGKTGVSGIRFFFWDSQFGRFFNTGPIKGEGDKFFFVHTLLWAFLPWSLPLYTGVGKALAGLVKRPNQPSIQTGPSGPGPSRLGPSRPGPSRPGPSRPGPSRPGPSRLGPEFVSLGSGLATFALFSLSGFQLPHYMNIVFPFFAILTAHFLVQLSPVNLRRWVVAQTVIGMLIVALTIGLLILVGPNELVSAICWIVVITLATFWLFRSATLLSLVGRMAGVMLVLMVALNLFLYPTFLHYQAGMVAARYANEQPDSKQRPTILYEPGTGVGGGSFWSYEFYANAPTVYARSDSVLRQQVETTPQPVFATAADADGLEARGFTVRRLAAFPFYHVSQLTYEFLNRDTRSQTLSPYVLAEVGVKSN